jgi:hypothetical protein
LGTVFVYLPKDAEDIQVLIEFGAPASGSKLLAPATSCKGIDLKKFIFNQMFAAACCTDKPDNVCAFPNAEAPRPTEPDKATGPSWTISEAKKGGPLVLTLDGQDIELYPEWDVEKAPFTEVSLSGGSGNFPVFVKAGSIELTGTNLRADRGLHVTQDLVFSGDAKLTIDTQNGGLYVGGKITYEFPPGSSEGEKLLINFEVESPAARLLVEPQQTCDEFLAGKSLGSSFFCRDSGLHKKKPDPATPRPATPGPDESVHPGGGGGGGGLSGGAIAGIVIAVLVVVGAIAAIVVYRFLKGRKGAEPSNSAASA